MNEVVLRQQPQKQPHFFVSLIFFKKEHKQQHLKEAELEATSLLIDIQNALDHVGWNAINNMGGGRGSVRGTMSDS